MLEFDITRQEFYDWENEVFVYTKPTHLRMEHSLISIAKWEAIWHKPYLPSPLCTSGPNTFAEEMSYVKCMSVRPIDDNLVQFLMQDTHHKETIVNYIKNPHSATTIHRRDNQRPSPRTITNEMVYYWMLKFNIPFECERWHFNHLMMLIEVCTLKESELHGKGNKMSGLDSAKERAKINAMRRAQMGL